MDDSSTVEQARQYYNSNDADNFYYHVWGGEDIHIGIYESATESIATASRRTVIRMCETLALQSQMRILDIGAGYGGSARYLAKTYGVHVTCLNLSEIQNKRNIEMNDAAGLSDQVEVVTGSFEELPFEDQSFDLVWSQDAILHSGKRKQVLAEVARMLPIGGRFIFTDPMQSEIADPEILKPVLDRIHLESMGSPEFYKQAAMELGLKFESFTDQTDQLITHYSRVDEMLKERHAELLEFCSSNYIGRMRKGLAHWIQAGKVGALCWGILYFRRV